MATRDIILWASNKLERPWSSPAFTPLLSKEVVDALLPRFSQLEPGVRMRVILSSISLRRAAMSELRDDLIRLTEHAKKDNDEWVRIVVRQIPWDEALRS